MVGEDRKTFMEKLSGRVGEVARLVDEEIRSMVGEDRKTFREKLSGRVGEVARLLDEVIRSMVGENKTFEGRVIGEIIG